jgi:predicted nucleotidyltransferase
MTGLSSLPSSNMAQASPAATPHADFDLQRIRAVVESFGFVKLAVVFGSVARGQHGPGSDLDLAVLCDQALGTSRKIALIDALALASGRPIDLIDLKTVGQPLLNQIVRHGLLLLGSRDLWAQLIYRNLVDQADFVPLRDRILRERRERWIGK